MRRTLFKSKIHRATVTQADLDYEGSVTISGELMEAADILPNEALHVWNVSNGERFQTYAIPGPRNSGVICINGAAAHKAKPGDLVILATFAEFAAEEALAHRPTVAFVDAGNRLKSIEHEEVAGPLRRIG